MGVTALVLAVAACAAQPDAEASAEAAAERAAAVPASEPAAAPMALTDGEIAAVVVAANSIDVRYGELARERAVDGQVRQFAERMIADHAAVNRSAGELVARLGVMPQENDVSRSLEQGAAQTHRMLAAKSGAEFDRAYIANEVTYHRAVLEALDKVLIPNATNAELKQTLVGVRPAFEAHLSHAELLSRTLSGS